MTHSIPENWIPLAGDEAKAIVFELEREICSSHKLFGIQFTAIARMLPRENFLFSSSDSILPYVVVHLTWRVETDPTWPAFTIFNSYEDFLGNWECIYE